MKSIICFFLGHKSVPMLVENDICLFTTGCSRCKCGVGFPHWKRIASIPPPNSTPEELKTWKNYVEEHQNELRNSVNKRIQNNPVPSAMLNLKHNWKI